MKDPAFLFYSSDFMMGTLTMSHEQVGMYIRLLCLQHQKGRLSEQDMKYICSTYEAEVYNKFNKDDSGMYYNERLENEITKRKKYSESRRENINKRYSKEKPVKLKATYVVHMENENENINKNVKELLNGTPWLELVLDFIQYRKEIKHPFKTMRGVTMMIKELKSLSNNDPKIARLILEQSMAGEYQGIFPLKNGISQTNGVDTSYVYNGPKRLL